MGSISICFENLYRDNFNLEISKLISEYLEQCIHSNESYNYPNPPCPTWNQIILKFGEKTPCELKSKNGLFPKKFLKFLFKNHSTLKEVILLMDIQHHLLIHLYLRFLP
jgi:hypothetical protein